MHRSSRKNHGRKSPAHPVRTAAALLSAAALFAWPSAGSAQPQPGRVPPTRPPAATPAKLPTTAPAYGPQAVTPPAGKTPAVKTGEAHPLPEAAPGADDITLSAFAEPVELTTLVEYVSKTLNLNTTVKGTLTGTVVFNAPVSVPKARLLKLLDALLEQQGFTITYDGESQFYTVHPVTDVVFNFGGEAPTTRIIPTPNVRPSYLKAAIDSQFFGASGAPSVPTQPGQTPTSKGIAYVDELGVIVVTESPRRVAAIEGLINSLLESYGKAEYIRLELKYVAAPQARFRALQLVGQTTGQQTGQINPQTGEPIQQQQFQGGGLGQSRGIDNLSERLTVDPLGNALIFRGISEEIAQVKKILEIIDAPNTLKPEEYQVGSRAKQIADIARLRGLGEITLISAPQQQNTGQAYPVYFNTGDGSNPQQQKTAPSAGGPVMVIDEKNGTIVYYGTQDQHAALRELIEKLNVEDERVVIRPYKLKHSDAEQVADIILNLIQNTKPVGTSTLLSQGGNSAGFNAGNVTRTTYNRNSARATTTTVTPGEEGFAINGEDAFVLADKGNNQVIVKAPGREQKDFVRLIASLDQRKSQVFIEAKIVAVTAGEEFRLAFETQLINANGTGGVFETNFGLSTPAAAGQPILQPKVVNTSLNGLVAAVIKSDQVPIVMTALARDTDSRILSTPQLLVDDNVESSVVSVQQQPTTTTTQTSGNPIQTSFGGYEEAGTKFTVTPHISSGGYLRLKYEINLSSFDGVAANGLPPPKQDNTLKSEEVSVPSNMTVVIGGLVLDSKRHTVVKVPLLGDIPIIGALFSDDNRDDRQTTLYVFLTPRILQDPTLDDYLLIAQGPQAAVKMPPDTPTLSPAIMEPSSVPVDPGLMQLGAPATMPAKPEPPVVTEPPATAAPIVPTVNDPVPPATPSAPPAADGKGEGASAPR